MSYTCWKSPPNPCPVSYPFGGMRGFTLTKYDPSGRFHHHDLKQMNSCKARGITIFSFRVSGPNHLMFFPVPPIPDFRKPARVHVNHILPNPKRPPTDLWAPPPALNMKTRPATLTLLICYSVTLVSRWSQAPE